jgi:AraC-like DNA-binding protein
MTIIYLLASIQALFLAALMLAKKRKSFADKVLMVWLTAIGVHTLMYFLHFQFGLSIPLLLNLNAGFSFLQGPFLLAYAAALIGMRERFSGPDYLHFVPFTAFFVYIMWLQGAGAIAISAGEHTQTVSLFSLAELITLLILISVPIYIIWSLLLMRRASRLLGAPDLSARFRWIRIFIAGLGLVWLTMILSLILSRYTGIHMPPHLMFLSLTLFVYALGYMGLTRTSVFLEPAFESLKHSMQPKYQKSGLGVEQVEVIYRQLLTYMEEQKPWLDGDLSIQAMATTLGFSTNYLSQVINEREHCSFRDFINARRVTEACRRLDENSHDSLLNLAMDCGFNSKSSFNRAFRKFTGKSPSEYTKQT